jgi:hypothetical protein
VREQLETFLTEWYGPPKVLVTVRPGPQPVALRQWYAGVEAWDRPLATQNRILDSDSLYVNSGRTVFYVENQAVWLWASGDGGNPVVFDRENTDGCGWKASDERLEQFLTHVAMFEAVLGAAHTATAIDIDRQAVERTVQDLDPAPFPIWRWPGPDSRLWIGPGVLVLAGVNDPPDTPVTDTSDWYIFAAARSNEELSRLDHAGIRWEHDSRLHGSS